MNKTHATYYCIYEQYQQHNNIDNTIRYQDMWSLLNAPAVSRLKDIYIYISIYIYIVNQYILHDMDSWKKKKTDADTKRLSLVICGSMRNT